jgi:hypothetical protein
MTGRNLPVRAAALVVEERPLVSFLYRLIRDGDASPARLEELLDDVENCPPAVAIHYQMPDIARYAVELADRLEQMVRPPVTVRRIGA